MGGVRRRAALVAWGVLGALLVAACGDSASGDRPTADSAPAPDQQADTALAARPLPELSATDPVFDQTEACSAAEDWYRVRKQDPIKAPTPRAELEARLQQARDALATVRETQLTAPSPDLADAVAIYDAFAERLLASWGEDGSALDDSLVGRYWLYFRTVMDDPVEVPGRRVSTDSDDASAILERANDQVVLACTSPPPGWEDARPKQSDLTPPPLTVLAEVYSSESWLAIDLATGTVTTALDGFGVVTPARGTAPVIGVTGPEGVLHVIDPATWTATPLPAAGQRWQCPKWTADGTSVVGDQLDPDGRAIPLRVELPGPAAPVRLPAGITECAVSIGPDEVAFAGEQELIALDGSGQQRTILAMDDCNLIPFTAARDGVLDVYANCANPYLDGLHLLDLASGRTTHLIRGRVGVGDVSPDGRWRVFTYAPHDQLATDVELWLQETGTGRTSRIGETGYWFPLFVDTGTGVG